MTDVLRNRLGTVLAEFWDESANQRSRDREKVDREQIQSARSPKIRWDEGTAGATETPPAA